MTIAVVTDKLPKQEGEKKTTRRRVADRVNRLNFLGEPVRVLLSHPRYDFTLSVKADPQPCDGETLEVHWRDPLPDNASQYEISGIVLPGDPRAFTISIGQHEITAKGISCPLPPAGTALPARQATRHRSLDGIKATLSQHSARFEGRLIDFSAQSLCVEIRIEKPHSRYWIVAERQVHLTLENDQGILFSGETEVLRNQTGLDSQSFVLAPREMNTPRFTTRRYRPSREFLFPEPTLAFKHPLTGRHLELNITNLSGLGMGIKEYPEQAMLLPGMILPMMHIKLVTGFFIPCSGQVVYRNQVDDHANGTQCGIAILDIDIQDHLRLLSLLQRAQNRNAHLSSEVDIEALWEFFFETGFIYPSKYQQLAQQKDGFLNSFRKTYLDQTPIARHFTFQSEGQIMAHLSAIRLYEQTWFQQHHAARRAGKHAVGLEVLHQLTEYFYNACHLNNDKIGYVAGFYRPENRFPSRYFRSAVKQLNNKKAASLDLFAYFSRIPECYKQWSRTETTPAWRLQQTTRGDLIEFNGFYEQVSGGCMADALSLKAEMLGRTVIEEEFAKLGLTRRRHLYSVKRGQELMAIIELHESDTGLSLSRMDHVVICYVLNDELPPELLCFKLQRLVVKFTLEQPPLMIFPASYPEKHLFKREQTYEMMIHNMLHMAEYMHFLNNFIEKHRSNS